MPAPNYFPLPPSSDIAVSAARRPGDSVRCCAMTACLLVLGIAAWQCVTVGPRVAHEVAARPISLSSTRVLSPAELQKAENISLELCAEAKNATQAFKEELRAFSDAYSCLMDTGGTCFHNECHKDRGAYCDYNWFMCLCPAGSCSSANGTCGDPLQVVPLHRVSYMLRTRFLWLSSMAPAATFLRSEILLPQVTSVIITLSVGRQTLTVVGWEDFETTYQQNGWDAAAAKIGAGPKMSRCIAFVKLVFIHWMQPLAFLVLFVAYHSSLGWTQWIAAACVSLKEVVYGTVISIALWTQPIFLLYQPYQMQYPETEFSRLFGLDWVYILAPSVFIMTLLARVSSELEPWLPAFEAVSLVGDYGAIVALVAGLAPWGAMWPPLMTGYFLCIISLPINLSAAMRPTVPRGIRIGAKLSVLAFWFWMLIALWLWAPVLLIPGILFTMVGVCCFECLGLSSTYGNVEDLFS